MEGKSLLPLLSVAVEDFPGEDAALPVIQKPGRAVPPKALFSHELGHRATRGQVCRVFGCPHVLPDCVGYSGEDVAHPVGEEGGPT